MYSSTKFAITIPTNSLEAAHNFYTQTIGAQEISRSARLIRYKFYNHDLVVAHIDDFFTPQEHCNHVDKYDVPVPHFGIVLLQDEFHQLSKRLT